MRAIVPSRRLLASVAVVAAAGVASAAGVGFAQDGGAGPAASTPAATPSVPNVLAGVRDGLAGLVAQGTIDQQQADAVQQEADAGSVDPKTLVASGVVNDAQMHAIADVIDRVKQAGG